MKHQQKLYRVLIYREGDGFWVEVPTIPGCAAFAPTRTAALDAIRSEIAAWLPATSAPCIEETQRP